jgi:hypothetical protein
MTSLDNAERKFYQDTISSLLQYNGMLITGINVLTSRSMMPSSSSLVPPPMSFSLPLMDEDTLKKMESAWKDSPFTMTNMMGNKQVNDMMRKIMGLPDETKSEDLK